MKTSWMWIAVPFLAVAGPTGADGMGPAPAPGQEEARPVPSAVPAKPKARKKGRHTARRLPGGDLSHCLALPDNLEVIRCAETEPGR
jgi:hypothetical protein